MSTDDASLPYSLDRNRRRMDHFVPNYLSERLRKEWDVPSIGCGTGYDVEKLRVLGYRAFGFDPGRARHFSERAADVQEFLAKGAAHEKPFGERQFDYAYALEVIEHVGCVNLGTRLEPDAKERRLEFMRACLSHVKPGGKLLVTTSNKICPIDPGHNHGYHAIGKFITRVFRPRWGLSLPIEKNFLLSFADIKALAEAALPDEKLTITSVTVRNYPRIAASRSWKGWTVRAYLSFVDVPHLRTGMLNPILCVEIAREA